MSADTPAFLQSNIYKILFEKSPGSLLIRADPPRFTILAASDTYLAIRSTTREAIVEKGFFEAFPNNTGFDDDINARKVFTKVIETGKKIDISAYRFDIFNTATNEYEIRYWSSGNTPISDSGTGVDYILITIADVTGEVKARETAEESENRLRLAAEATALATWDINLINRDFIFSSRLAEIFGHPPETTITLADIRAQISTEDMQNIVVKAYQQALKTGHYLYEVKILWNDGSVHWIKTQGITICNKKKQPIRMLGTVLDITESKSDEIRKNDFLAMASHELKTPLTSLKAYLQILTKKMSASTDTFINGALLKATFQVNKMTALIHAILDLSKLESGRLQLKIQSFEINKLIADTIAEINLSNPGYIINFEPEDLIINLEADKEKIGQVISNLLSNAMKYSDIGTCITIISQKIKGSVKVSVSDQGIGIKHQDQAKLFQRFYRVENEKMQNISGFGIGLYLAREIIKRHQGKIWMESEEDKGATFYFSLPLPVQFSLFTK